MKKFLWLGLGVLVAVTVALFFWGRNPFSQNSVEMKIDGPTELAAGELAEYKVTYKNNSTSDLVSTKLIFYYPDGATALVDERAVQTNNTSIEIGRVPKGASGEYVFKAYLVGDSGNIKSVRAKLVFSVNNISSVLEKDENFSTTLSSPDVSLSITAPPNAQSGQNISYTIQYKNQSNHDLADLRLKLTYPNGFVVTQINPSPTAGNNSWDIATLAQGEQKSITISGPLKGNEGEQKGITALLQRKLTTSTGEQFVDYQKTQATTLLSSPPLSLQVLLNDSTAYTAHLDDRLEYAIVVKNNSNFELLSLDLSAKLTGSMFDFSTVDSSGFFDSRTNTISWNSSAYPALGDLKQGQTLRIPFKVRLKKNFPSGVGAKDAFIKVAAHIETANVPGQLSQDRIVADGELTTRISSAPAFDELAFVGDASFGSSGPFPPKVDKKTVYYIHWSVVNPANDLKNTTITASLPPGATWENRVRTIAGPGQPVFTSRTNTISWNIGAVPAATGTGQPKYEAVFAVSVTPSTNQVGSYLKLLTNTVFNATDSFTNEKFSFTIPEITTRDIADFDGNAFVQ